MDAVGDDPVRGKHHRTTLELKQELCTSWLQIRLRHIPFVKTTDLKMDRKDQKLALAGEFCVKDER